MATKYSLLSSEVRWDFAKTSMSRFLLHRRLGLGTLLLEEGLVLLIQINDRRKSFHFSNLATASNLSVADSHFRWVKVAVGRVEILIFGFSTPTSPHFESCM